MASSEGNWIDDIINDFIHSSIWSSPIQTFINENCACFDYDDDNEPSLSLIDEQKKIYKRYQKLVDELLTSLSDDLKLDRDELNNSCEKNNPIIIDESYEQLYSTNNRDLFKEMMKRKNLILQLQALVSLQLECGVLKPSDTDDDRVLQLLIQATSSASSSNQRSIKNPPKILPNLKEKDTKEVSVDWHRQIQTKEEKTNHEPKTIDSVPDDILREKLRELTIHTETSSNNDESASAILSRKIFLKQQRDLIINKQRNERVQELEKETANARPQSAANVARKAMGQTNNSEKQISNDELEKRRIMAAKLRREVVDKQ
ncbi:unnamed protein product [Adineta steineri]|uniref:Cilia- and flagella-associated protein 36 n=1 Tax=Adineta steineri TaxID=433720 RepID=A0A814IZG6_9BILA|nr:unnamed protein product [Adineta steineri]CAF1101682.1 unnamed protein product [Adineta steineri]